MSLKVAFSNCPKLDRNKVVLGISGGVDSTTAALLLQKKGYEVHGMYFDVKGENEAGRVSALEAFKASRCTGEFHYIDASKEFDEKIITNFCEQYMMGRTPNPCVICNPMIKFKYLIEVADRIGAYYIATGHYARTYFDELSGKSFIRASESKKDQSYMLYRLESDVIARLLLPLGDIMTKDDVRKIARQSGMKNAELADSQEICFIDEDKNYIDYIAERLQNNFIVNKGDFIDKDGKVLGKHNGIANYTLGQRKGLGIALGRPAFVTAINPINNTVTLGENEDLFTTKVYSSGNFFTETGSYEMPASLFSTELTAKVRYAAKRATAHIELCTGVGATQPAQSSGEPCAVGVGLAAGHVQMSPHVARDLGLICTTFAEPQRAPTPGQSIVFYKGDVIVGGGFITAK